MTKLTGKIYEVSAIGDGNKKSEAFVCFPTFILQKDNNAKKPKESRKLLKNEQVKRRIFFCFEAEQCDRKLLSDLILQGRLKEAVRFITNQQRWGCYGPKYMMP